MTGLRGAAAGAAVAQDASPPFCPGGDRGGQAAELGLQPGIEGGRPVVGHDAHRRQDFDGMGQAGAPAGEHGVEVRHADDVASGVAGQQRHQVAVQGPGGPGHRTRGSRPWCGPGAAPRPARGSRAAVRTAGQSGRSRRRGGACRTARAGSGSGRGRITAGGGGLRGRPFTPRRRAIARGRARRWSMPAKNSWWWRTCGSHGSQHHRRPRIGSRGGRGRRGPGTSTAGSSPSSAAAAGGGTRRSRW